MASITEEIITEALQGWIGTPPRDDYYIDYREAQELTERILADLEASGYHLALNLGGLHVG